MVLRRIFGPKRDEVKGNGESYIKMSIMSSSLHQILFGCSKRLRWVGHVARIGERCIQGFGEDT